MDSFDHRGQVVEAKPESTEPATRTIVAALLSPTDAERMAFRRWMGRRTDHSGRLITPHVQQLRLEAIRAQRDPAAKETNR